MTVPDAAEKFLTLAKKTVPTAELAAGLLKGGLKSAAKNFASMLNTVLTRDDRFVRVNREWGLDAWYPGMRKTAGRKRTGSESTPAAASAQPDRESPAHKANSNLMVLLPTH